MRVAFVSNRSAAADRNDGRVRSGQLLKKISPGWYKLAADFCNKIGHKATLPLSDQDSILQLHLELSFAVATT
ncbi:MAG: hypothetical protein ACREV8_03260, partial [Gammaproteobacteria bacterium]